MEYHAAANVLFDLRRFAMRPGTAATRELLAELDDPHEGLSCVQVAGTNGKGSTARMLEQTLSAAGYSVGLYTSPHLDDVRERVRVDGRPVTEARVAEFVDRVEPYVTERGATGDSPTFFETLTALALWTFDRADVDVAVLEVGIGGRHDATSVVDPVAAAVTDVSLEHTAVLGDDVATIARDVAQVAPEDRPLVTAATGGALDAVADAAGDVRLVEADEGEQTTTNDGEKTTTDEGEEPTADTGDGDPAPSPAALTVDYDGRDGLEGVATLSSPAAAGHDLSLDVRLPLLGAHQARNAGVAATLAGLVLAHLESGDADWVDTVAANADAVGTGLRRATWPGRFEVVDREPLTVLDGAHNPAGAAATAATLAEFDYDALHVVAGAMVEKDLRGIAAALPEPATVRAARPPVERAETADVVAAAFAAETDANVTRRDNVAAALAAAREAAGPDDCVLVVGSLYAVAQARRRYVRPAVPTRIDDRADAADAVARANVPPAARERTTDAAVHRTLRTRVEPRQARILTEELNGLGGAAAVSGVVDQEREPVEVVLSATLAVAKTLCDRLERDHDQAPLAATLRAGFDGLDVDGDADSDGNSDRPGPRSSTRPSTRSSTRSAYPWSDGPAIMGICNVTPDSFHDGGEYEAVEDAVARAEAMAAAGASIVDVGGESTRPGADPVSASEERERVVPVIEAVADSDATISVDTRKAAVASAALEAGADLINDVSGLADPAMRFVAADHDAPVVVMHSRATPVDPDATPTYDDVVEDVIDALAERVLLAEQAGLDREQIIVDPGLGFGKTPAQDFELLGRLDEFQALGCPVMVGHSHKSMFARAGATAGDAPDSTVAATALAVERGADVVRVHDVPENVRAVDVALATRGEDRSG